MAETSVRAAASVPKVVNDESITLQSRLESVIKDIVNDHHVPDGSAREQAAQFTRQVMCCPLRIVRRGSCF